MLLAFLQLGRWAGGGGRQGLGALGNDSQATAGDHKRAVPPVMTHHIVAGGRAEKLKCWASSRQRRGKGMQRGTRQWLR